MGSTKPAHNAGNTDDEDPSSETDENQPLYTESDTLPREPYGSTQIPDNEATPQQVREFITQLLVTKRSLPIDHARRIAARWTIGNGHEMGAWPVKRYAEIFGDEDGRIVYKDVQVILYNAGRVGRTTEDFCAVGFSTLGVVLGGLISLTKQQPWIAIGAVMVVVGGLFLILVYRYVLHQLIYLPGYGLEFYVVEHSI
ncbi:hypothetical protein MBLNU230_g5367t1 [Neophaeotheca triangularis]